MEMNIIKKFQGKTAGEMIRYLLGGGCTTMVNLAAFYLLRQGCGWGIKPANLVSILFAILFAFVVNKWLVFQAGNKNILEEFAKFVGMRLGTMVIEFYGVIFLCEWGHISEYVSKLALQVIVIALNYLISKFLVFGETKMTGGSVHE